MKKYIYSVVASVVFAVSAMASQGPELNVDFRIPFAFQAGTSTLPAGTYTVSEPISGFVLIRSAKGGVFVPASAVLIDNSKATLRFDHEGEKYVLQAVHPAK